MTCASPRDTVDEVDSVAGFDAATGLYMDLSRFDLVVVRGPGRGSTFRLTPGVNIVGRGGDAAIQIQDPFCSRKHVEITLRDGRMRARDLGSRNGTLLNGGRLAEQELACGDEIQIGDVVLLVGGGVIKQPAGRSDEVGTLGRDDPDSFTVRPGCVIVGTSEVMRSVREVVERVSPFEGPVLITGESGTGKEMIAEAIHRRSSRAGRPFVIANCACLDGSLVDAELFGHERGAFTGATETRAGCIERATGGTLFLDEVGELPLATQAKLLRVVEDKPFQRLGGSAEIQPRARLVAATNRDLEAATRDGRFRQDLLFRLNVLRISLPPLRERLDDVPQLIEVFLEDLRRKRSVKMRRFGPDAMDVLRRHGFPGNVRELLHIVQRVAVLCDGEVAGVADLPPAVRGAGDAAREPRTEPAPGRESFPALRDMERELVEEALRKAGGNKTQAARLLGIHRATLYKMLGRWGIKDA